MPHADGLIHPGCMTIRDLLEISSVKKRSLIREVHAIQKFRSSRSYPVANVDDLAPLPRKLHEALKTPEAHVASSGQTGHRYTDRPLEVPRAGTKVDPLTLPDLLQKAWPELNTDGARVLTAQYMGETTGGKTCWNYNLGNVKCMSEAKRKSHLHQYLPGTWEYWPAGRVKKTVQNDKNSRYATPSEIVAKVIKESDGKKVIFFKPPDLECCFLAFKFLGDAVVEWTNLYKRTAQHHLDFLNKLNKGDCAGCARILKGDHYYSQNEAAYAKAMTANKQYFDRNLK